MSTSWNIEQEKKEKVGGRPAKVNEKKSDRDLDREMKDKGDTFLLEEQHENFVTEVTKCEMLAATNARWKWAAVKKSERERVRHFLHNIGTFNVYDLFWMLQCNRINNLLF